ncbi:MAG: hypothetical protein MJA32_02875 [Proteobacteria bacterium]|nr:hypothetical protein [Pseudomonadota bacterium]
MAAAQRQGAASSDSDRPVTVTAAVLLMCAGVSMFQVEPLFLGVVAEQMTLSGGDLGILAGVELLGAALGSICAVFWVPHFDWRKVAFASLGVIVAGNLLSATAGQFHQLVTIRCLTGVFGQGTAYAVGLAVVSDMRNPERVFGITVACQVGLAMLAMVFMPPLIERWGAGGVLYPLAVFALLVLPFSSLLPAAVGGLERAGEGRGYDSPAPIVLALGTQVVWYLGVGAVWAFLERIGAASHIELADIGAALAIGMGVGILGALLASVVGSRCDQIRMYALAMIVQVAALLILANELSWVSFVVAVTLFNISWNFALPFLLGAIAAHDHSGRFTVLLIAAQGLGVAVGPVIAGVLSEVVGYAAICYFAIAACVGSVVVFRRTRRFNRGIQHG